MKAAEPVSLSTLWNSLSRRTVVEPAEPPIVRFPLSRSSTPYPLPSLPKSTTASVNERP